jgi:hypothetical protein
LALPKKDKIDPWRLAMLFYSQLVPLQTRTTGSQLVPM